MVKIPLIGSMPAIGLGTWRLSGTQCTESVAMALELGYRHIDTADMYDNHAAIAPALRSYAREQLFLVSKIVDENLQKDKVAPACERILKELQTPYLDVLLIHWPSDTVPARETLEAMLALQERGLIRHIGVSNFTLPLLKAIERYNFPILTNQIELHPYLQENVLVDYCEKHKIHVTAYRPIQRAEVGQDKILVHIGERVSKTAVQVTLRWLFQRNIIAIPKATSKAHLKANLEIFDFTLSDEEMDAIKRLDAGKRFVV